MDKKPIRDVNAEHYNNLKPLEKVALMVTKHVGTMGFFLVIFTWTAIWLSWNILAPAQIRFDPFPGFVMWLFISNMIQIMLMPLIMVGQNLQGRHAETRTEADLEVNIRAEQEVQNILKQLAEQKKLLEDIQKILKTKK